MLFYAIFYIQAVAAAEYEERRTILPRYKYQKITIDYAKEKIQYWEHVISVLQKCEYVPTDPLPEKIFKLYANLQSVKEISSILKEDGIINNLTNKPYTSTEITNFIKNISIEDKDIEDFVKSIQKKNIASITKIYN